MKNTSKKKMIKWILPLVFTGLTIAGYFILSGMEKGPEAVPVKIKKPPMVDVLTVSFEKNPLKIKLSGTVTPLYKTGISSEVSGRVIYISDKLVKGGCFEKGEKILKIDDSDYRYAVVLAKAELASAKTIAAKEKELGIQAKKDWKELGRGVPTELALRKPQIEEALARLESAKAQLEKAELDLGKTEVKAPFRCMVSSRYVSMGSFVSQGEKLFEIFNLDIAEIRLPVSPDEAELIDMPSSGKVVEKGKDVFISWSKKGKTVFRKGYISRTEAEIDPETRFQYLIVRVDDPYGLKSSLPELKTGQFADVEIDARVIKNSFLIPSVSLSHDNQVMKVNFKNTINFADVKLLKRFGDKVLVSGDLEEGERIVISPLEFAVEGTIVRLNGDKNGK